MYVIQGWVAPKEKPFRPFYDSSQLLYKTALSKLHTAKETIQPNNKAPGELCCLVSLLLL